MTRLEHRLTRLAWLWCVLHTAGVPEPARTRRRAEVLSHLWESEAAGLPPWQVLRATVRGAADDVSWSLRRTGPGLVAAPPTWVAVAASLPVSALLSSSFTGPATANLVERLALVGSLALLAVSALLSRRSRG